MTIIFDGNNILNIAYARAKGLKIKELKDKIRGHEEGTTTYEILKNEAEAEVKKYLTSFSVQIFLNILHKYLKENKQAKFYFVWDSRNGAAWRKEASLAHETRDESVSYKSNREEKKKDIYFPHFIESIEIEEELLKNYPLIQLKVDGAEADDVIYNLCQTIDDDIKIISTDQDMIQLAQSDDKVKVYNPVKKELQKIPEYDIVLFKAIKGDPSDNIPGLFRFGEKKAIKTINEGLENLTEKQKDLVQHYIKLIDLSMNPNVENNQELVNKLIQNYKINVDAVKIKETFFKLKLRSFIGNWSKIRNLLTDLEKNYGGKEKS